MNAQSPTLAAPPLRWLIVPVAGLAIVATVVQALRHRAREPRVTPVSDEWLREAATRSEV